MYVVVAKFKQQYSREEDSSCSEVVSQGERAASFCPVTAHDSMVRNTQCI
jgi:predicted RNA-binding Zn-ribbon protein involved in translation (DUF1610 family)